MGNLHQTPVVIFCYIAPVQWTLSEVLVNQATGQGKWWGNLLKHQHWRLLWNMWISFQIEAIKWVLLLFDLPSAKVREHIHVLHVEGCIPSPFDLDSWRGHTMRTPKHGCMYVQTTDFVHFLEIITGFDHNWKHQWGLMQVPHPTPHKQWTILYCECLGISSIWTATGKIAQNRFCATFQRVFK